MKKFALTMIGVLLAAGALMAHHSYGTFYDLHQTVILKGKVTKYSFAAPHVMLTIEARNSGTWQAEWTNPDALKRAEWARTPSSPATS
jgi:hypothetical protein